MILTGERVLLRLASPLDVPAILAYLRRNRRHLQPWTPNAPRALFTQAHWRRQITLNRRDARAGRSLRLFLFERPRPERVIGTLTLDNFVRGPFQACHLGYALDARSQGRGLMTEALQLALAHAFGELNLHRVMANYLPRNRRSARVLRRLGFRIEGRAKKYLRIAGRWEDHVLTSKVNRKWHP